MINAAPLARLLSEKGLTLSALSQLSGIAISTLAVMIENGTNITQNNLNNLCSLLKCQPCDIIEFTKSETKGHWEWVEAK